jgi:hypothetical protein
VTPVYADRLVAVGYSRLDGKHLLESWIRLLALAAGRPAPARAGHRRAPGPAAGPGRDLRRRAPRAAAAATEDVVRVGRSPAPPRRPGRGRAQEVEERQLSRRGRRARPRARLGPPTGTREAARAGASRRGGRGRADPARRARRAGVAAAAAV